LFAFFKSPTFLLATISVLNLCVLQNRIFLLIIYFFQPQPLITAWSLFFISLKKCMLFEIFCHFIALFLHLLQFLVWFKSCSVLYTQLQ